MLHFKPLTRLTEIFWVRAGQITPLHQPNPAHLISHVMRMGTQPGLLIDMFGGYFLSPAMKAHLCRCNRDYVVRGA